MQILSAQCSWKCSENSNIELDIELNTEKLDLGVGLAMEIEVGVQRGMEIAMTWPDWFKINVIISISWRVFLRLCPHLIMPQTGQQKGQQKVTTPANGKQNQYHFVPSF